MSAWLGLHTFQHGIYDRIRTQPVTQRHGNAVTILILSLVNDHRLFTKETHDVNQIEWVIQSENSSAVCRLSGQCQR